ncbi:hypothetical protein yc1106_04185 [Curvularia clavata]|uniref:BTB domain-containing protein n=1 Tax=Curvularia clavata TaxID=95742 RepID=A0A9Q9DSY8_CURCL|nr:hypothetical protein yc1106_04185 [Curvularia clavata]
MATQSTSKAAEPDVAKEPVLWGDMMLSDPVIVKVGLEQQQYYVHKDLITRHSYCFYNALKGPWKEAHDKLISLDDVEITTFDVFFHWLYFQSLAPAREVCRIVLGCSLKFLKDQKHTRVGKEGQKLLFLALTKAIVFGDGIFCPKFSQAAHNALVDLIIEIKPDSSVVMLAVAQYAEENLPADNKIHHFFLLVLERLTNYTIAAATQTFTIETSKTDLLQYHINKTTSNAKMKQSLLQKAILISLLGFTSAQTSSWGEPFTVDVSETAVAPTDATPSVAVPSPIETSTLGQSITPDVSSRPTSFPTSFPISGSEIISSAVDTSSLAVDTSSLAVDTTTLVVSSAAVSSGNATMTSSTSSSGSSSSLRSTTRSSATESSTTSAPTSTASVPGAAASLGGYQKMAFAGAIAGIGGAMFL